MSRNSVLSSTAPRLAAALALLLLVAGGPAKADGSNVSGPAPTPPTPAPLITSEPQVGLLGDPGCVQQLDDFGLDLDIGSLAADYVTFAADIAGLLTEGVGEAVQPAGNPVTVIGVAAQVAAKTAQVANLLIKAAQIDTKTLSNTLPNCNANFTGTIEVEDGGVNVTGESIFKDDVGVDADVHVSGEVTASQVHATQGISAHGGGIWLGDPNGTTYSSGITIGGGAVSGAGSGGDQAFTGDVDAIAIGNGSRAMTSGSVALGLDSSANGEQDVVIGADNQTGVGGNNTVVGNEIDIIGATSSDNTVLGVGHQVEGSGNFVGGDPNTVVGSLNVATGVGSSVAGDSNVAIGDTVTISGDRAIAVGNNATANNDDTTVIGTNARADAEGSAAYGHGAVASLTEQQVFGTRDNTYTAPGITSGLSRSRQSGPLDVATSDSDGNLATDGGLVFRTLSENRAGLAIAMAIQSPDLDGDERFGFAMNWGVFERSHGLGFSAIGVIGNDLLGTGERIAFQGGFGLSVHEESIRGRRADSVYGGRAGFQVSW